MQNKANSKPILVQTPSIIGMTQSFAVGHVCDDGPKPIPVDEPYKDTTPLLTMRATGRRMWANKGILVCTWNGACVACGQRYRAFVLKDLVRRFQDPGGAADAIARIAYVSAMQGHFVEISTKRPSRLLDAMGEVVDEDHFIKTTGRKVWLGSRTWVNIREA